MSWPRPFVTVDVVILTISDGALRVLLIPRISVSGTPSEITLKRPAPVLER